MTPMGASQAERRLLPEGRLAGPMPWVIAIMMFLTALAAAGGLAMDAAVGRLGVGLGREITAQIIVADPGTRDREAAAAARLLGGEDGVVATHRIGEDEMQALLRPWLGDAGLDRDLPLPAMIDVELNDTGRARLAPIADALRAVAPHARIDDHAGFVAPLIALVRSLGLLAAGIVAMMAGATAAAVTLAARSALNTHRRTIDVMHMMGATDVQVARLFQRRIALDALFGALIGTIAAMVVIVTLGRRVSALGSGLVGSVALPGFAWGVLLLLPVAAALLALLVARLTVRRALGEML